MLVKAGSVFLHLAHLLKTILSCTTSIRVSSLHFGQNNGNFTRTVSWYTLVLVFPPQIGQRIQRESPYTLFTHKPPHLILLCVLHLVLCIVKLLPLHVYNFRSRFIFTDARESLTAPYRVSNFIGL